MHNRCLAIAAAILMAPAAAAAQPAGTAVLPGSIDFGVRTTEVSGDAARFQHFRDTGDGLFVERLRLSRTGKDWRFDASADNAGRRDQRYAFDFRRSSKLRVAFSWDQIPLFNSSNTRTPYLVEGPGLLRLPDGLQQGIQGGTLRLADAAAAATILNVRSRRDVALLNLAYSAARDVDLHVRLRTARREGTMPLGVTFGFGNTVELPAPIDTRTTDVGADAEWANARGMLRIAYDGSWFDNDVPALVWDSPLRLTATATLPSEGRYALWPNSTLHAITTAGAVNLPARSRLSAHISVGSWRQNESLLPFTINSLVAAPALERSSAEGEARTLAMNYTATSRPVRQLWLNARFRYYDFDNRTPELHGAGYVRYDSTVNAVLPHSRPLGSTRRNLDLDASFTPVPFTALRIGYGRDWTDRTYRIFSRTTEDMFRTSIDSTWPQWLTVRAIYEASTREGSGFDETKLTEASEQPAMRHFDIADRDRRRVTGLIQLTPAGWLGLSASASTGKDDYKNSGMGLRDSETRSYALTADLTPVDQVALGLSYTNDRFSAVQRSRSANAAQKNDPLRNWTLDNDDRAHTVAATVDLLKVVARTDLRLSYDSSRSTATYVHRVAAGSPLATPQVLPAVRNDLRTAAADLRYALTTRVGVGFVYWYDSYRVDDFALGAGTMDKLDQPSALFLGYGFRPYTAHSGSLRLTVAW